MFLRQVRNRNSYTKETVKMMVTVTPRYLGRWQQSKATGHSLTIVSHTNFIEIQNALYL